MRRSLSALLLSLALAGGCKPRPPAPGADDAPGRSGQGMRVHATRDGDKETAPAKPLERCFAGDTSGAPPRPLGALLERAAERYDREDYAQSLVCADEAARVDPRSIEAHHDRGAALEELGRLDDAARAFTRALALDPDDPETLAATANLYINGLPASNDNLATGLEYARRGSQRVRRTLKRARKGAEVDKSLMARLLLLEGQALNDLGRPREALARLDAAVSAAPGEVPVRYERGVALFNLCRFAEAKKALGDVVERDHDNAWAHQQLGLTLERLGDTDRAELEMAQARTLAPDDFKPPVEVSEPEFKKLVWTEAAKLPTTLKRDLLRVQLETSDVPDIADLTADEPPLSPTIVGLFRGQPLPPESSAAPTAGRHDEPRAIVLYRKNLGRAVTTRAELIEQIRTTLLHELGHLRGEDDDALRARGLE